jgi:hypothetical protein
MDILLSSSAGFPLDVEYTVGSRSIETIVVLGTLTVLSFDNCAEEATARSHQERSSDARGRRGNSAREEDSQRANQQKRHPESVHEVV